MILRFLQIKRKAWDSYINQQEIKCWHACKKCMPAQFVHCCSVSAHPCLFRVLVSFQRKSIIACKSHRRWRCALHASLGVGSHALPRTDCCCLRVPAGTGFYCNLHWGNQGPDSYLTKQGQTGTRVAFWGAAGDLKHLHESRRYVSDIKDIDSATLVKWKRRMDNCLFVCVIAITDQESTNLWML